MRALELYIHIPFCVSKCRYCDFLSAPAEAGEREAYVGMLLERIRSYQFSMKEYCLTSIFLGGGTPSLLDPDQTERIFEAVYESFQVETGAEITTELNPGTVNREKLHAYRRVGINRLSIGLQSADNEELKILGRIHRYEDFLETYREAREAGFANINVDLMAAIPFQTPESYERSLRRTAELGPEHISAYSLIIEEGTDFYDRYGEGRHAGELPDEETERQMYWRTDEILKSFGYHRYEISNYAREGYECRHNLGYWNRAEYLGIGAGAASLIGSVRFREPEDFRKSGLKAGPEEVQELTLREEMEEYMFLGLRKIRGVSRKGFRQCFQEDMDSVYGDTIKELCRQGLLEWEGDFLRLTERGTDICNYVMSRFLF